MSDTENKTESPLGDIREMSNERSMEYLSGMYGQVLAGLKLILPKLPGRAIGRVLEIYAGLPFVKPVKSPQSNDEVVLLQGLIKLGDLRTAMLELVNEQGEVKSDESK